MGRHSLCPEKHLLCEEARRIVLWAGSLTDDGEEIGGIGQQLRRAAERLRLHDGVVWRAYQRRSGPEIYPSIDIARNELIARLAVEVRRKQLSSRLYPNHLQLPMSRLRADGTANGMDYPKRQAKRTQGERLPEMPTTKGKQEAMCGATEKGRLVRRA